MQPEIGMPLAVGACVGRVVRRRRKVLRSNSSSCKIRRALERLSVKVGQIDGRPMTHA